MIANRGIYNDGWYANTTPPHGPWILNAPLPAPKDYKWELYNLSEDYSQANDLAAKMPDKLKEMQKLFVQEAAKYNVLPLDNDTFARSLAPRPSATAGKTVFTYSGVNPGINSSNAPNILGRSYTMTADVDVPQGGGDGMLATMGGRWGGWGLYLLKGKPVFHYNMLILAQYHWEGSDALTPGKHAIGFDYTYDGPGIAKGGSGVLKVDGKVVATGKQANSIAFLQVADETFDVGLDTRTGVNGDYQVPFAFDGKIDKLTVNLGPMQLTAAEQIKMREATALARD
jgi:arylsulfatase